jgi:Condensation domain
MWFFEQLSSGTSAFNMASGVRLAGSLNVAALEQTFSELMRRHEVLRTVFPAVNGEPRQVIQPPRRFNLPVTDLSRLPETEREVQAARLAQEETLRKFDLARGPLARPTLLKLSDEEHLVICTLCHIIGDGQSFEVVIAEMSQLYTTMVQGSPSPLAELSVQYVDYAAWQRQWLQGEELERRLNYWRRQLADAPEKLNLPQRGIRPRVPAFGGASREINLSPQMTAALRELSRREGLTLFMTLLSAFVLLLNLYTDDEDLVVGSVYANRERVEAEKLVGILANTIVLRVDLSGADTFRDVMRQVRRVCVDAYTHQLSPELLREDLAKRGEDRERLFDVWFQVERQRKETFAMHGLETSLYGEGKEVPRFELSLNFGELEEEIIGKADYDDRIFSADTMAQMLEDYHRLLELMTANPEKQLATISLATTAAAVASLDVS